MPRRPRSAFVATSAARLAASGLALLVLTGVTAATAQPVSAAEACKPVLSRATVGDVVTYGSGRTAAPITVVASDACTDFPQFGDTRGVRSIWVSVEHPGNGLDYVALTRAAVSGTTETWRGVSYFDHTDAPGLWYVDVDVEDADNYLTFASADTFSVRLNAGLSMNASPEPVVKYAKIAVTGKLVRLSGYNGYVNYAGVAVKVYFKPVGATSSTYLGYTTTNAYGNYAKSFTATRDGTWYAHFPGWRYVVARWSAADYVDVR